MDEFEREINECSLDILARTWVAKCFGMGEVSLGLCVWDIDSFGETCITYVV